jgi:hypothetical protein
MLLSRCFEPPNLLVATLAGVMTSRDQADLVEWVREAIRFGGPVRLLVLLDRFVARVPTPSFESDLLWLSDDEGVFQIAIVGQPQWRLAVLTLIGQPLRRIPIEYFETEAAARRWFERDPAGTTKARST